jgi:hypothetical protein
MRLSQLFFTTLRDDPADAEMPSHRLLLRAGYIRQLGSGLYSLLPLGFRVTKRVEQIIREEMNAIGCQELEMPVIHPADLWRESGRYDQIGPEMARFKDRGDRDMVIAMTHEEVVTDLLRDIIRSYRQLPVRLYHFQTKFRDEPRSRGGLIRVREFVMKDSYSCDRDDEGLDASYWAHHGAYVRIFERLGLEAIPVASDVGMMGGSLAHEFMVLNPAGEDLLVLCDSCGFSANRQVAEVRVAPGPEAELLPMEEIETPGTTTIAELAAFLDIPAAATAKAAFFMAGDGRLITAIVRGDREVNETKLSNAAAVSGGCGRPRWRRSGRPAWSPATARRRRPRHDRGRRQPGRPGAQPGRRREPGRLPPPQRQRGPRLPGGPRHRHRQRPRGRRLSRVRTAGDPAQRDRGRQHLQARDALQRGARGDLPGRGWPGAPDRDGLVRDRPGSQRGLHRGGPSRREGDRLAGRGCALSSPPGLDRGQQGAPGDRAGQGASRRGGRRRARDPVGRPGRLARA